MKIPRSSLKPKFDRKVLIIGYGSVAQCTLPVFLNALDVPLPNVTIIDPVERARDK